MGPHTVAVLYSSHLLQQVHTCHAQQKPSGVARRAAQAERPPENKRPPHKRPAHTTRPDGHPTRPKPNLKPIQSTQPSTGPLPVYRPLKPPHHPRELGCGVMYCGVLRAHTHVCTTCSSPSTLHTAATGRLSQQDTRATRRVPPHTQRDTHASTTPHHPASPQTRCCCCCLLLSPPRRTHHTRVLHARGHTPAAAAAHTGVSKAYCCCCPLPAGGCCPAAWKPPCAAAARSESSIKVPSADPTLSLNSAAIASAPSNTS